MRIKTALSLPLLLLVAGLSACGGSIEGAEPAGGPVATAPSRPVTQGARSHAARARRRVGTSCVARGIVVPPFNDGACVQGGRHFVVANGRSVLHLKTLAAAIRRFAVTEGIVGHPSISPLQGAFMHIMLRVENRTGTPQRLVPGRTQLAIRDERFDERADVEQVASEALGFARRAPIPPGESIEGDLIFDLPPAQLEAVTREGLLYVDDFGQQTPRSAIGIFRIFIP